MIDPISAAGAAGALAEITGSMSGMSMAQAYEENMTGTYDPYDPTQGGLQFGYGSHVNETPAISGDTSGTFTDSNESDPQQAWLDWMHDGGLVNPTTGGAVIGSNGSAINYSLMRDSQGNPQAVQPIAIERSEAIVALGQVLGVSMNLAEVDPILGGKMANALIAAGVVYDKAKDLFTCWWDGVNILFPKKAVDALDDLFTEEGIGPGGDISIDYSDVPRDALYNPEANFNISVFTLPYSFVGPGGWVDTYTLTSGGTVYCVWTGTNYGFWTLSDAPHVVFRDKYPKSESSSSLGGNPAYYRALPSFNYSAGAYSNLPPMTTVTGAVPYPNAIGWDIAYLLFHGTVVDTGFPPGTEKSEAPSYTPADLVPAGAVMGKNKAGEYEYEPVVPVVLPSNPTSTIGETADPVGATNPERTQEHEKDPPIALPIPGTTTANPEVDLVDSSGYPAEKIDELVEDLANTVDPQPPISDGLIPIPPFMPGTPIDPTDPSSGSSYPTIIPSSGSGLIHVYNPTPSEFVSFGHWLWVTYADATIDKIWNNPFDGIIGAHELYATPGVSGRDNIRSGFLVCPTSADLVPNRYTEIDCGTVVVPEFYGNYLDYSPYSQCYIYLPFIGINEVSIDDIVGHAVNIRYRVDSYNGSCIAMIYVAKQNYRNLCYQFAGNCAVEVPLAGGSQAAIKAGMMQAEAYGRATVQSAQIQKTAKIGTGIVQGAHAGAGAGAFNPIAGIVGGLLGGLAGGTAGYIQGAADYGAAKLSAGAMQEAARVANKSSVQHSGQFGASHGAMGLKVPFIMIRNPIQVKVVNYNEEYGFPAHKRVIIGGCTGYLRVREVNVVSAHATNEEKIAIEEALKNGVYVS